jgi:membrane-associated protein
MEDILPFLEETCQTYGYPALFVGVLLENAGVPVPGETAVLVAGFLAASGVFDIYAVIGVTAVAAILGDNVGFWLGHRFGRPRLQAGGRFLFLTPNGVRLTESYFQRFGSWTIFFARFITGLRVIGALAAGTAGMPWRRFLVANAAGAVTWATTISLLGYCLGQYLPLLERVLSRTGLVLLAIAVIAGFLAYYRYRRRPAPADPVPPHLPSERNAPSQAPSGEGRKH